MGAETARTMGGDDSWAPRLLPEPASPEVAADGLQAPFYSQGVQTLGWLQTDSTPAKHTLCL